MFAGGKILEVTLMNPFGALLNKKPFHTKTLNKEREVKTSVISLIWYHSMCTLDMQGCPDSRGCTVVMCKN